MGRIFFKYFFIKLFCGRTADVFLSVKRPVGLRKIGHDLINTTDYTQIDGKKVLFISLDYKLNVVFEILLCVCSDAWNLIQNYIILNRLQQKQQLYSPKPLQRKLLF
jgi:hypothetical protein